MRNFVKKLFFFGLFFVLFSAIINLLYLGIIAFTDWDFRKRIESITFENPDYDLLILGNSFAEYGIDADLLTSHGISTYNLALIGNSDQTSYIQLKEYLSNYQEKPRHVILCLAEFSEAFFNDGIQPIVEFTMKDHAFDMYDVPLSKFRWFGVEVLKKILSSNHRNTRISGGQVKMPKIVPDHSEFGNNNLNIRMIESSHWVGEIARLCDQHGINLIIIEMPGFRKTQNLTEIGPLILKFENGSTAKHFNFNSRDFNTFLDYERDWSGMSHLNMSGASVFTKQLIKVLTDHKAFFPDTLQTNFNSFTSK